MKRSVTYEGNTHKVRSDKIDVPDFKSMDRLAVLVWLNKHTYSRGHTTKPSVNLRGLTLKVQ